MVAEGNDDEIEDVVIPTIPDAVGPMVSQGLSNLGLLPPVTLTSPTTANAREQVDDFPTVDDFIRHLLLIVVGT